LFQEIPFFVATFFIFVVHYDKFVSKPFSMQLSIDLCLLLQLPSMPNSVVLTCVPLESRRRWTRDGDGVIVRGSDKGDEGGLVEKRLVGIGGGRVAQLKEVHQIREHNFKL
jgi:hypothetical protein